MEVRPASRDDADQICTLVRRSIVELCEADHRGDQAILEQWLANKTPANVAAWIAGNPGGVFVAADGAVVHAVAIILPNGEVVLNYVSPDVRFSGTSKALMRQLEKRADVLHLERLTLSSTETAHRFYRGLGYTDVGEVVVDGKRSYRMEKRLSFV